MSEQKQLPRDSWGLGPGDVYVPDGGAHEGHRVTVIANDMPSVRFDEVRGNWDRWVVCECGAAWTFSPPESDEAAKDGDGWPE